MAFREVPYLESYEIDEYGNVRTVRNHRNVPYTDDMNYVIIDGKNISVLKLMAHTYIGPSNLTPFQLSQNIEPKYVTYIFKKFARLDDMTYMIDGEIFKRIPNFSDFIINQYGVIWSLIRGIFIHNSVNHNGYLTATITDDTGFRAPRKVAQLVYAAWVGPLDKTLVIDHHDNFKTHNYYRNLRQITTAENVQKGTLHGRYRWSNSDVEIICKGIRDGLDGLQIADVLGIDYETNRVKLNQFIHCIKTGKSHRAIAARYGINDGRKTLDRKFTEAETLEIVDRLSWRIPPSVLAVQYNCLITDIEALRRKHMSEIEQKSIEFGVQRLSNSST